MNQKYNCKDYNSPDCPKGYTITRNIENDTKTFNFVSVGCWGVYCWDGEIDMTIWKDIDNPSALDDRIVMNIIKQQYKLSGESFTKKDKEKIKKLSEEEKKKIISESKDILNYFEKSTELYGQKSVMKGIEQYTKSKNVSALFLAGDNVYNYNIPKKKLLEMVSNSVYPTKKQYKADHEISGQDIDLQLSVGFTDCLKNIDVKDIFIGVGNHDIQNCYDLNQQLNYGNNYQIGLYYNVVYPKINFVIIDTNMFGEKLGEYEKTCNSKVEFTQNDIDNQVRWVVSAINEANCKWNIIIGHVPYMANGHKESKPVIFNENLNVLFKTVHNECKNKVQVYMCADEHNQQFLHLPDNKLSLVVAGSGGTALDYDVQLLEEYKGITRFISASFGFVSFEISENTINIDYHKANSDINFSVSIIESGEII